MSTRSTTLSALFVLSLGFVGGLVLSGRLNLTSPSNAVPDQAAAAQNAKAAPSRLIQTNLPDLSAVAEAALKAAANISSTTVSRAPDDIFSLWFYGGRPRMQRSQSLGSGVIVSEDGYILTNNHVVGDAGATVRVTLGDGVERPAKIVGVDDVSDLAVLKVDAHNLQTLPWGDSTKLRIAEWVLAVGNPFQLSGTVTLGIISTVNRSGAQVGAYGNVIQTDAAINPGNSGGALVNAHGEVVGINSMIYSETGGYQGIGFAIPSNEAMTVMNELRQTGTAAHGDIGPVQWFNLDRQTAINNGLGDVSGVMVYDIGADASGYEGGLRVYDVVQAFNGQKVDSAQQLQRLIVDAKVGTRAKLDIVRGGRHVTLDVPIVRRQARPARVSR